MATFRQFALSVVMMLFIASAFAYNPEWLNLTNSNYITSMAQQENILWVGSRGGGLAKIDIATGNKTFYNRANSGLPSNQIEAIKIDAANNIWIGTYDQGLVLFDSDQQWQVINRNGGGFVTRNDIYDIQLDVEGNVWIGTLFSILKYDGTTFTDYPLPGYTGASTLLVLAPDDIYAAWYTTGFGSQVFHFDGTAIDTVKGLDYDGLYKLYKDSHDRIWACYTGGVALKNGNDWVYFDSTNSAIPYTQTRTLTEWNGTLLLGTDNGVFAFNGTTWTTHTINKKNINLLQPVNNKLYVGTLDDGLFTSNGNALFHVQASNSKIPSNQLYQGINNLDNELLFRIPWAEYLATFSNNTWGKNSGAGIASDCPAMALAPDNSMWFCNYDNLFHLTGSTLQSWKLADYGIPSAGGISSMAISPTGTVYVGSYTEGFFTFDGTDFKRYNRGNSTLSSNRITSFAFPGQAVLIGTNVDIVQQIEYGGGIEVFNGNTFSRLHPGNSGLQSKYISHLLVHGDSLWIGGDGGFSLLYNGTYTNYLYNNGSGSPLTFIKHMAVNSRGEVFATGYNLDSEGIMVKWDGETFEIFDGTNSPVGDFAFSLNSILFDKDDNLWVLHNTGVFVYKEGGVTNLEEDLASGINATAVAKGIKLYPNPTSTSFTVDLPQGGNDIAIYNMLGAQIYFSRNLEKQITINAINWQKGLYIYHIQTYEGLVKGKLLIE